jgi:hypothetical protein
MEKPGQIQEAQLSGDVAKADPPKSWELFDAVMDNPEDEEFFLLAIQSVLHNQRMRIHLFLDSVRSQFYIKEMAEEILRRANRYKKLSGSAMRDVMNNPPDEEQ